MDDGVDAVAVNEHGAALATRPRGHAAPMTQSALR
jgi:hypothetical protein